MLHPRNLTLWQPSLTPLLLQEPRKSLACVLLGFVTILRPLVAATWDQVSLGQTKMTRRDKYLLASGRLSRTV